jgi:hypothetical protein
VLRRMVLPGERQLGESRVEKDSSMLRRIVLLRELRPLGAGSGSLVSALVRPALAPRLLVGVGAPCGITWIVRYSEKFKLGNDRGAKAKLEESHLRKRVPC